MGKGRDRHRRVKCSYCVKDFRSDHHKRHERVCKQRIEEIQKEILKCIWCDRNFFNGGDSHIEECKKKCLEELELQLKKTCIYCNSTRPHIEGRCVWRIVECFRCRKSIPVCHIKQHMSECKKTNKIYSKELKKFIE